jgi:hypothetical protein
MSMFSCRKSISAPSWFDCRMSSVDAEFAGQVLQLRVDFGQRGLAVDVGFAAPEQVEVGAVQDEDFHGV